MGTSIEWTDETWNPVTGCTKVSQGCKHCYAERLFPRPYPGRAFTDVRCHAERLEAPLRWRKPRRVFVNSMSDLFHEAVPDEFIDRVFAVMALADRHTFQVLTKRPERMRSYMQGRDWGDAANAVTNDHIRRLDGPLYLGGEIAPPLPNVWLGVSCEDQATADERIPLLLQTPAAVRFVSCEPLLGPIDLREICVSKSPDAREVVDVLDRVEARMYADEPGSLPVLDWVIVGGESGPHARPCDLSAVRSLVSQCDEAGVPCFVKQLGKWIAGRRDGMTAQRWLMPHCVFVPPLIGAKAWERPDGALAFGLADPKGGDPDEWPDDLRVQETPVEVNA